MRLDTTATHPSTSNAPKAWYRAPRDDASRTSASVVQVSISWGEDLLAVRYIAPGSVFVVGADAAHVDFPIPENLLPRDVSPVEALELVDYRRAVPVFWGRGSEVRTPNSIPIHRVQLGNLTFELQLVDRPRSVPRALIDTDRRPLLHFGASALATALLMGAAAYFTPPLGVSASELSLQEQAFAIQQYLEASAERETEPEIAPELSGTSQGGEGARADGAEGQLGEQEHPNHHTGYAVQRRSDEPEHLSREQALDEARTFGLLGILATTTSGDRGPTAPWGAALANGSAEQSFSGNLFGETLGDAYGAGALSLSGTGVGSGGTGVGIGLGEIGTLDHGAGCRGEACGQGIGHSRGLGRHEHVTRVSKVRMAQPTVSGRIPSSAIQRIVRQNFGRFRLCYEAGLRRNPNLEGRVSVRFLIDRNGSVAHASLATSDLPDSGVVTCVTKAYYGLSFPTPEMGTVNVTYPILFTPD